tara:strand:+ start:69 stop:656 length:588 start_codon:yes stop_codon:yes gene_type:complete
MGIQKSMQVPPCAVTNVGGQRSVLDQLATNKTDPPTDPPVLVKLIVSNFQGKFEMCLNVTDVVIGQSGDSVITNLFGDTNDDNHAVPVNCPELELMQDDASQLLQSKPDSKPRSSSLPMAQAPSNSRSVQMPMEQESPDDGEWEFDSDSQPIVDYKPANDIYGQKRYKLLARTQQNSTRSRTQLERFQMRLAQIS